MKFTHLPRFGPPQSAQPTLVSLAGGGSMRGEIINEYQKLNLVRTRISDGLSCGLSRFNPCWTKRAAKFTRPKQRAVCDAGRVWFGQHHCTTSPAALKVTSRVTSGTTKPSHARTPDPSHPASGSYSRGYVRCGPTNRWCHGSMVQLKQTRLVRPRTS
jgi:hypothetical protein